MLLKDAVIRATRERDGDTYGRAAKHLSLWCGYNYREIWEQFNEWTGIGFAEFDELLREDERT